MTSITLDRTCALVASAVVAALLAAAPAAAQEGCAGVEPNGCAGQSPCHIVAGQPYGSVEWEGESNACLDECPDPEHCHPDFASNVNELSRTIAEAIDNQKPEALWAISMDDQVTFNPSRNAIQVAGCVEGTVAAHFPLPHAQALVLRDRQAVSTPESP